jgi:integron integrase
MGKMQNRPQKAVLPEFQQFLLARKLVPEKYISFYAHWANRYLNFIDNIEHDSTTNKDLLAQTFIEDLRKKDSIADWQIRQAESAVKLYRTHYLPSTDQTVAMQKPLYSGDAEVLKAVEQAIRVKHYSYRTEQTYLDWIKRFQFYLSQTAKVALADIKPEHVRDYLSHLAVKNQVSSSTQNQAFNAILFLMRNVLNKDTGDLGDTVRAKRGARVPVVLSVEETVKLFKCIEGTALLIAQLLYGTGLRLMELARLRVQDIDFQMNTIMVRGGKGDKDRTTLLPETVKKPLYKHLEKVKALHLKDLAEGHGEVSLPHAFERKSNNAAKEWGWQYVFPSARFLVDPRSDVIRRHHISDKAIQTGLHAAVRKAGISKRVTVHTLRHSFATHLLMNGVNIREVQSLLGHKSLETTMIYTHVMKGMTNAPKSPLDSLMQNPPTA